MTEITISQMTSKTLERDLNDLTDILHACVHAGASVGFILPFNRDAAAQFWTDRVFPTLRSGGTVMFAAQAGNKIVGTVQLGLDLLPNQPHRADVAKLLVHPNHQRQGIARLLMARLETHARQLNKTLLVLDTRSGDTAQDLYTSLGFQVAGEIPGYCRNPFRDVYEATTYMYKPLSAAVAR